MGAKYAMADAMFDPVVVDGPKAGRGNKIAPAPGPASAYAAQDEEEVPHERLIC